MKNTVYRIYVNHSAYITDMTVMLLIVETN